MFGKEVISGVMAESFQSKVNGDALLRSVGLDASLLRVAAPVDDEVPPNGVTNLTATPIYAGMRLAWDLPPAEDIVRYSVVEVDPNNSDAYEVRSTEVDSATIFDLDSVDTTFRVKVEDEWGRESLWSEYITARPVTTADTDIDLAYKQAQGTLQGLIEAVNLAGASAESGIRGVALASTQANNMLPLVESDLEMWNNTTEWPPPDALLANNTRIIDSNEPAGHTLDMTRHEGHWKIRHVRATPSTNYVIPVTGWREERRVTGGETYMAQATVSGPAGAVVSIAIENASTPTGTDATTANESQFTLGGGTVKIYTIMQANPAKPYVRIRLGLHTDSTTVYWYKFMLEHARLGATEPSPWNAGILAVGSVAAHTLTALTANVAQAVIAQAAIQDGMIANLKADKIVTGSLNANLLVVSGSLQAAGATIDSRGIFLKSQETNPDGNDGANGFPLGNSIGDWLTSNPASGGTPRPHSGIGFFDDHNDPRRGILIRARGVAGKTRDGIISIGATSGGVDFSAKSAAQITIRSNDGGLGQLRFNGFATFVDGISVPNGSITSDEIGGLHINKLNNGTGGGVIPNGLLPNLDDITGKLSWDKVNHPDMTQYLKREDVTKYTTIEEVTAKVKGMVKANALR